MSNTIDGPITVPEAMTIKQPEGWRDVLHVLDECRSGDIESPEQLVEALSMHGFNFIIRHRLDAIYPRSAFGGTERRMESSWYSNEGGREIDPGVKWIILLRAALDELGELYLAEAGPSR
jgi:hypothetical protein